MQIPSATFLWAAKQCENTKIRMTENQCKKEVLEIPKRNVSIWHEVHIQKNPMMQMFGAVSNCVHLNYSEVLQNQNSLINTCLCLYICRSGVLKQLHLKVSAATPSLVLLAFPPPLVFLTVHKKTHEGHSCCSLESKYSVNTSSVTNNCILDMHRRLFSTAEIMKRHFRKVWGAKRYLPPQNLPRLCELWNCLSPNTSWCPDIKRSLEFCINSHP